MNNYNSEIIYASGFIDGEGHVEFKTRPKKNSRGRIYPCKVIRIEVCNTDFKPVKDLQTTFNCGFISYPKRRLKKNGLLGKQQIKWSVAHKDCYRVSKLILPFIKTSARLDALAKIINYYEEKNKS